MPSPVYNGPRDFLMVVRCGRITKYLVYSSLFCALRVTHHGATALTSKEKPS